MLLNIIMSTMYKTVDSTVDCVENTSAWPSVTTPTKIYHAKAGNYAGMIGAVLLGFENL